MLKHKMLKQLFALAIGVVLASATLGMAGRADEAKLTEVRVCPISQHAVQGDGAGSEVVGAYKVFFCCGGCQPQFDKLSQEDKEKKVAAALKKQEDSKKQG